MIEYKILIILIIILIIETKCLLYLKLNEQVKITNSTRKEKIDGDGLEGSLSMKIIFRLQFPLIINFVLIERLKFLHSDFASDFLSRKRLMKFSWFALIPSHSTQIKLSPMLRSSSPKLWKHRTLPNLLRLKCINNFRTVEVTFHAENSKTHKIDFLTPSWTFCLHTEEKKKKSQKLLGNNFECSSKKREKKSFIRSGNWVLSMLSNGYWISLCTAAHWNLR